MISELPTVDFVVAPGAMCLRAAANRLGISQAELLELVEQSQIKCQVKGEVYEFTPRQLGEYDARRTISARADRDTPNGDLRLLAEKCTADIQTWWDRHYQKFLNAECGVRSN